MMYAKFIQAEGRFAFSPTDNGGVQISNADYAALFAAQGQGKQIVPDAQGYPVAVDPGTLMTIDSLKVTATARIDADADDIRRSVIGARATEYQTAYDEATAFKNAGYTGTVPPSVQAWVDAKAAGGTTWTAQQAADDILLTAAQWLNAQYAIRANRLKAKEKARASVDKASIDAAVAEWAAFVAAIRSELAV